MLSLAESIAAMLYPMVVDKTRISHGSRIHGCTENHTNHGKVTDVKTISVLCLSCTFQPKE